MSLQSNEPKVKERERETGAPEEIDVRAHIGHSRSVVLNDQDAVWLYIFDTNCCYFEF